MTTASGAIAVGISLGSESCTLAVAPATTRDANGTITSDINAIARPTIIAAEDGERSTPAYGAWVDSELLIGAPGKNAALRHPQRSVGCLGPLLSQVAEFGKLVKAKVEYAKPETLLPEIEENDGAFVSHPVSELLLGLFQQMNKLAVGAAGAGVIASVVVAVPRYVSVEKVLALVKKVEFPGVAMLEVMYDDAAAMLANGIGAPTHVPKTHDNGCLVVDVGASATQVSVLTVTGGVMSHVASDFSTKVGGKAIDAAMATALIETFRKKSRNKIDAEELSSGRPYRKLLTATEKAKKTLTSSQTANCEVEAFYEGADLTESITRGKLDGSITTELNAIKVIEELIEKVLKKATEAVEGLAISHVVLHGGVMRIPCVLNGIKDRVLEVIESVIENDDQLDMLDDGLVQILDAVPGDESAALGAAIQASLVANGCDASGHLVEAATMKRDVLTFDIGFWNGEAAPQLNEDGEVDLPKPASDAEEDEDEGEEEDKPAKPLEPSFTLAIQRGSPLPTEVTVVVPSEAVLLPLARTAFKVYTPVASSVVAPKADSGKQALHILVSAEGELSIIPVPAGEHYAPETDAIIKAKLF